ncbi:50S ribosomal protein L11 methyltransferase [bacterium]|nr:MAG: 50S ribosomal protein L11 methyltransferase [bacterium]
MNRWVEVAARVETPADLAIVEALACMHALRGTAIEEQPPTLRAWFSEDERESAEALRSAIAAALPRAVAGIAFVADAAWGDAWREYFRPQRIGEIAIVPSWERAAFREPARAIVEIDPGQAFGTGLHPTTRGCLLHLQEMDLAGRTLTDVGTGSGILALAAAMLGAQHVYACDVDPVAVRAARENADRNGLTARVRVERTSADLTGVPAAHVVVANLTADIILGLAPALCRLKEPGGVLLLAGIVAERELEVVQALGALGLRSSTRRGDGEWVSLRFRAAAP